MRCVGVYIALKRHRCYCLQSNLFIEDMTCCIIIGLILAPGTIRLLQRHEEETESSEPEEKSRSNVRMRHAALAKQLNAYGVLLILLAGAMSVAILQPPGSVDTDGHIRTTPLVGCYLLFASLSFLLACTGLYAVMAGTDTLFDPAFYAAQSDDIPATSTEMQIIKDNIFRVKRLKAYLGTSLLFCMIAFALGAFAVLGPGPRNWWMAIGTVVFGVIVLSFEGLMTLRSPSFKAEKRWLTRLRKIIYL